jgi:hypothetical protein
MFTRTFAAVLLATISGLLLNPAFGAETESSNQFGFTGPEIFPIENQISQLHFADLDGDGLNDLIVVNNSRSRISLLLNQTGKTNTAEALKVATAGGINELPPDARFRIDSISSEKRISSLVVADLNGDSRPDIAYYGEPKELIVQYNQGTNKWSLPKRFPIDDGTLDPFALVSGDIDGDKRRDLLLLGDSCIYVIKQKKDGSLAEPEKLPYIGSVKSLQVLDIQGDGRNDLLLANWDNPNPFRFRLQNESGKLGPEIHFPLSPIRSYWADDLDGDGKTEIITIAQKSGRAQVSTFQQKEAESLAGNWKQGQFELLPLTKTSKAKRGTLWADLNGDGRSDLVVADPENGQMALSLQNEDGTFDAPRNFATLTGISDIAADDWDGDGHEEIFVLSSDERQIGVTHLDEHGGLAFPKPLVTEGRPLAMTSGKIRRGESPALACIIDIEGKRELQIRKAKGDVFRQKLSEDFKANPSSLLIHDVDQDGLPDLLLLVPYEKMKVLLQQPDGHFKEIDVAATANSADRPWVGSADVDGDGMPELLLPQRNFLRAGVLKMNEASQWTFDIKEQINAPESNSRIVAAVSLKERGKKFPTLFMLDAERKWLSVVERTESGAWNVARNIALPYAEFQELNVLARGADAAPAISLSGLNAMGLQQLAGKIWDLKELDGYETPIKDGFLHDVITGDLNGDGKKDLVFLETGKGYLDLVTFQNRRKLVPADRWQVFEERTFRSRRNEFPEPREALIADFTGDGKNDLVVLVHDRILLYPQE